MPTQSQHNTDNDLDIRKVEQKLAEANREIEELKLKIIWLERTYE